MFNFDTTNMVHSVLGACIGVAIFQWGEDNYLLLSILVEDDDIWHKSGESFSTFWLPDALFVLNKASIWLQDNAVKQEYGYYLKEK